MNYHVLVGIVHDLTHRLEQFQAFTNGEPVAIAVFVNRDTLDEVHDQIGPAFFGGTAVEQFDNVRMVQRG